VSLTLFVALLLPNVLSAGPADGAVLGAAGTHRAPPP
jgi:hypothetical protein